MREQLAQIAGSDWREVFSYMLGLMASYAQCMSDRPLNGKIYYYIIWKVEDGVGVDATLDAADDFPPEGNVTAEDVHAFYGCVDDYLQANATISLPHARTEAIWGMQATFPVHDARIYEMIAASKE